MCKGVPKFAYFVIPPVVLAPPLALDGPLALNLPLVQLLHLHFLPPMAVGCLKVRENIAK